MRIDPNSMELIDWANAVNQQLGSVDGENVDIDADDDWRVWANRLLLLPRVANQRAPRPDYFDDWRSWASAFNQCVEY